MTRRQVAVAVFAAGALWGCFFATGFTEYTSNASVLATGLGGFGLLGVWSVRRRFLADNSLVTRWNRVVVVVAHDVVTVAVAMMTGRQLRDFLVAHSDVRPSTLVATGVVVLIGTLTWWLSANVLWRAAAMLLVAGGVVALWTAYSVVRVGGERGNHMSTVVGSGASSAMILRGVAVAVVSYVLVDVVVARWLTTSERSLSIVRPAIIALTFLMMALTYVVVTGAGSFVSSIPFTFAGVAAVYGGHSLQVASELLYLALMVLSVVVLLRDFRDSHLFGRTFDGGASSLAPWALRAGAVLVATALPFGIAEIFQVGVTLALVSWFFVGLQAMVQVSGRNEPWYEWFPPVVATAAASLGLYGAMDRHLSWDGQGASRHFTTTLVILVGLSAVFYFLDVRRLRGQRPGAVALGDQREVE